MLEAEDLFVSTVFVNFVVCELLTAILAAEIYEHAHWRWGQKAIHVETWWCDALEHIDGLDQNSGRLDTGIFPDDDRAVTFSELSVRSIAPRTIG